MKKVGNKLLGNKKMYTFFSSLNDISDFDSSIIIQAEGVHCNCNSVDDWCPWGSKCFFWGCGSADAGCGWWLQEICNGFCARYPIELTPGN